MRKIFFSLLILLGFTLVLIFLLFGTISPCGIAKQQVRQQFSKANLETDESDKFRLAGQFLGLSLVDTMIDRKFDTFTPDQCISMLVRLYSSPTNPFSQEFQNSLPTQHVLATPTPKIPEWEVSTSKSPVDDSESVVLRIDSNETIVKYSQEETPALILRCAEKETAAFISFGVYLGLRSTTITHRLDKEPAKTQTWSLSTDNKAAFIPKPIQFINELARHEVLFVRVTPYGESPKDLTFKLLGLSDKVEALKSACKWK